MKTKPTRTAFTLVELLVVLATLVVLGALVAQGQLTFDLGQAPDKAKRINCVNNLKQIGLAQRLWANDNGDHLPVQIEAKKGGSLEAIKAGETWRHYQVMSNELVKANILVCPSDNRGV